MLKNINFGFSKLLNRSNSSSSHSTVQFTEGNLTMGYNYSQIVTNTSPLTTNPKKKQISNRVAVEKKHRVQPKTLKFLNGSEGFDKAVNWCIKNFIPASSVGVLYAPSASLKSFVAIDMACSVACGISWCGNKTTQAATLYVAAEGAAGTSRRIRGWEIKNQQTAHNLFVLDHSVFLTNPEDKLALVNAIKEVEESHNLTFDLIILDTLARNFSGDEKTQHDMSKFITECDSLKTELGCSIFLVHHTGKDASKGARGSSALRAACDFEFQVRRIDNSEKVDFINTKQKDAEEAATLEICFETIALDAFDDEANELETLVKTSYSQKEDNSESSGGKLSKEIIAFIETQPGKKTTRKELRNFLYPVSENLDSKARKQLQRALKQLQSFKQVAISLQGTRAHDYDEIKLT